MESISSSKTPQGVVVICDYIKTKPISSDKVLCLDNVSDPGNLGTLLRTALAFGYKDVILLGGCFQYNEKVLQSTQGAIFDLNIVNDYDLELLYDYEILATEIKGSAEISTVKPQQKHVLVLGNEAHGVSEEILKIADKRIRIDIQKKWIFIRKKEVYATFYELGTMPDLRQQRTSSGSSWGNEKF